MTDYCKFCGKEVELDYPSQTDKKYIPDYNWKVRPAKKEDRGKDKHFVIEKRFIKVDKTSQYIDCVVGRWIAKDGCYYFHAICSCGKVVYKDKPFKLSIGKPIPAFRTDLDTKEVIEVWLPEMVLFEMGVHWYPMNFDHLRKPILNSNTQLNMFYD